MPGELTGSTSEIHLVPYHEAYDVGFEDMPRRVPDLTKLNGLIGYNPEIALDDILKRVIAHMRETLETTASR